MSEEKKLDEKTGATALDDTVLEAVSGGEKSRSLDYWANQALADVKEKLGANENKEQQS